MPVRGVMMSVVRVKGEGTGWGGGGGRLRHVVKLSLVPREKLNLHAFCSHIHRVNTKSIAKSCSETWSTPICGEYFLYRSQQYHNHIDEVIQKSVLPFSRTYSDHIESYETIQEINTSY